MNMKYGFSILITTALLLFSYVDVFGQNARQMVRKGNDLYEEGKYTEAEVQYMKSLENDENIFEGKFNRADAMIRQKKYDQAIEELQIMAGSTEDKANLAKIYHNMGNAFVASEKLEKGLEAYKLSLRNNPADDQTRYNLAYVQHKLNEKQQEQEQKDQDQEKPEPSEYAKALKKRSDEMISRGLFRDANQLMQDGLKKDETVAAYNDYIERLGKVTEIDK